MSIAAYASRWAGVMPYRKALENRKPVSFKIGASSFALKLLIVVILGPF